MPIIGAIRTILSGSRERLVGSGFQRVLHRQRTAVGEPDHMQGHRRPGKSARLPDGQARGRGPLLPLDGGQAPRNRAVAGHADRHRHVARLHVALRDMAQAVGRIRQAVQQHHRAGRCTIGLHDVGTIPVARELARIDRAVGEVAVAGMAGMRLQALGHLGSHFGESLLFGRHVPGPVRLVDLHRRQFMGDEGVPEFERRPALRVVCAHGQQGRHGDGQHHRTPLQQSDGLQHHGVDLTRRRGSRADEDRCAQDAKARLEHPWTVADCTRCRCGGATTKHRAQGALSLCWTEKFGCRILQFIVVHRIRLWLTKG